MNKKLYSILFFVPFIVSLLAMTVVTGCSDDDEPLQSTYGYVQFKLLKSASIDKGTTTRAVTDKLDKDGTSHTNQRKESRDRSARTIYGRFGPNTETLSGTMVQLLLRLCYWIHTMQKMQNSDCVVIS